MAWARSEPLGRERCAFLSALSMLPARRRLGIGFLAEDYVAVAVGDHSHP